MNQEAQENERIAQEQHNLDMAEKARLLEEEKERNDQERKQLLAEATELAAKIASDHTEHVEALKLEMEQAKIDAAEKKRIA